MTVYRRVDDLVTCGLTACTPGSAPGPTLGNEYGKPSFTVINMNSNIFMALIGLQGPDVPLGNYLLTVNTKSVIIVIYEF